MHAPAISAPGRYSRSRGSWYPVQLPPLVEEVTSIMQEARGTTVQEMPGILVGTFERPADIVVLHLEGDGQHLVVDVA